VPESFVYRVSTCYGLDLSASRLVIIKSTRRRGGKGAEHSLVCDAPPRAAAPEVLESIQSEVSKGRAVTAAFMPSSESFARWLQTPLASLAKARKVAPSLLDIQLPFPLEECAYDMVRFRKSADGRFDVLAVAARTQDIAARLDLFRRAGIEPMRLDHEALAMWAQGLREIPVERNAVRVVAFIGDDHSTLAFGRGTDFLSAHSLRAGTGELEAVNSEPARRFVLRAQQLLRAQVQEPGDQTLQWIWTGPAVSKTFTRALEDGLRPFGDVRFLAARDPTRFLGRAVAESALEGEPLSCNFRAGPLAHPEETRHRNRQKSRIAAAVLAAGLLLCVLNAGWRVLLARQKEAVQEKLNSLAQQMSQMSRVPKGQEVLVAERAAREQAPLAAPFLEAFEPSMMTVIAGIVGIAHKHNMAVEYLSLKKDAVSIRGAAAEWSQGELLAGLLRARGFTAEIQRQDAGADERVHFTIKAQGPAPREAAP
jgi:hypothetical protein